MNQPRSSENGFAIFRDISDAIAASGAENVRATAELIVSLAAKYTGSLRVSLMLVNERGELYLAAAVGMNPAMAEDRPMSEEGVSGYVAKTRTPLVVTDVNEFDRIRLKRPERYGTNSFISCPIVCRERTLGVINITDICRGEESLEHAFRVLNILSAQAAIALENAFLMAQLRSRAAELAEMNQRLQKADSLKNEFIVRISHELRTPLNSIKGSLYYLDSNRRISRRKQKEFLEIIAHGANELRNSVEHLLAFLRRQNTQADLKMEGLRAAPKNQ